jgi:competence protein ComGC
MKARIRRRRDAGYGLVEMVVGVLLVLILVFVLLRLI